MQLAQKLDRLSYQLYRDHFHLLNSLIGVVDDCGCRLGTVDLGTEDSGSRVVSVFGLDMPHSLVIGWTTTEYGNLEANFRLFFDNPIL